MKKIILIGGAPMTGKTTIAVKLASVLEYACMSTDDIGESLRAKIKNKRLNPILGYDYREYYISRTADQLIDDTRIQHEEIWPSVKAVIKAHSGWGKPVVIEGWNLYPQKTKELNDQNIESYWLTADENLLKTRIEQNRSFYEGASDIGLLTANYLKRSLWHNNLIKTEAQKLGMTIIKVTEESEPGVIADKILKNQGNGKK